MGLEHEILTPQQKLFFQEIETSIKAIYKNALDILSEISEKEETAIEKLVIQLPQLKQIAPFLLVIDDTQYGLYRSHILDVSNGELRKLKDLISGLKITPVTIDLIKIKSSKE